MVPIAANQPRKTQKMLNPEQVKIELERLASERQAIADSCDRRMEALAQKIKENPALAAYPKSVDFNYNTGKYHAACTR